MLGPQEIRNGFYRIESRQRHLNEERVPECHRTIPESRPFECQEFPSLLRFAGNDRACWIGEPREEEFPPAMIVNATDEIDGVEMGGGTPDLPLRWIVEVDLRFFDYLEGGDILPFRIVNPERTSSRFTLIFHHPADPERPVEPPEQVRPPLRRGLPLK